MRPIRETLEELRAVMPDRERGLIGYSAIAAWFEQVGWVTREGYPPHPSTVKRWRRQFGLPVAVAPFGRAWTTTFLLMAWCMSPLAQRLSPRRVDGTLKRPVKAFHAVRGPVR